MRTAAPPSPIARARLRDDVAGALGATRGGGALRVGLEVELIPVLEDGTRLPLRAAEEESLSGPRLVGSVARASGWVPQPGPGGIGRFQVPTTGWLSFEPGGQLELSTRPFSCSGELLERVDAVLRALYEAGDQTGVRWVTRGLDPQSPVASVPQGIASPRYARQAAHYDALGPWGARMMRHSAAVHVNLDMGGRPVRRWGVANRAAPYLTALFANSRRSEGADSGWRSFRAEQWRNLDPSRTGLPWDGRDPVGAYLSFALEAADFLGSPDPARSRPFKESWGEGASPEAWRAHLTTLFPEVRPRGYLELRSFDALRPAWLAVPVVVSAGLLYDPTSLSEAERLLPEPDADTLRTAGRTGLGDAGVRAVSEALFDLAVEGARRLPAASIPRSQLDVAGEFRARFVSRGEDPGSEADPTDPFVP